MGTTLSGDSRMANQLDFLQIDEEMIQCCRTFKKHLAPELDKMLDTFYGHISSFPHLRKMLDDARQIPLLKKAQASHWLLLFEARFDEAYLESIDRIGHAHERIGLEPQWYIASYTIALNAMLDIAARQHPFSRRKLLKTLAAINKVVFLDMCYAISIYDEALKVRANRKLNETVDEINGNIQSIATAVEELSAAMREVSMNSHKGAQMASELKSAADMTMGLVDKLNLSANDISHVVALIQGIASQTNLLALNATIEAASAGDAGRGFAVVANEVKALARQSALGGDEIRENINSMLGNMQHSVSSINEISTIINEMTMINAHIASAIEEQSAVSNEISHSIMGVIDAARRMQHAH